MGIVSVVRAESNGKLGSIGFVKDTRRMNVAFTRARTNLWVIGHMAVLKRNIDWEKFITQQQESTRVLTVSEPYSEFLDHYLNDWLDRHPDVPRPSNLPSPEAKGETMRDVGEDESDCEMEASEGDHHLMPG